MKLYIKANSEIASIDKKIRNYLGNNLIYVSRTDEDFRAPGWVYIFKINNHNVYRVFLYEDELIFQCVQYAFYVDGQEFYDDAQDYKYTNSLDKDTWFDWFVTWIDECEASDPEFTIYEEN